MILFYKYTKILATTYALYYLRYPLSPFITPTYIVNFAFILLDNTLPIQKLIPFHLIALVHYATSVAVDSDCGDDDAYAFQYPSVDYYDDDDCYDDTVYYHKYY